MSHPTRRALLQGGAGMAIAAALPGAVPGAGAGPADADAAGIGSLYDGHLAFPADFYLPHTPAAERTALLEGAGLDGALIVPDCNVALFRDGDNLVLFDTGAGGRFTDSAGRLPAALEAADVAVEDVTHVVFTHAHPDHLWGVLDDFDEPMFPEAEHFISRAEWDFWTAPDTIEIMPDAQKAFAVGAARYLAAIEDRIVRFSPGSEIIANVHALDTAGHTPGHCSYELQTPAGRFVVVGDVVTHPVIAFERPDWPLGTDMDADRAVKARRAMLDLLASEQLAAIGYHWTRPGLGTAERKNGAFRYVPL